jgi:hypothetical protein
VESWPVCNECIWFDERHHHFLMQNQSSYMHFTGSRNCVKQ